MKKIFIIPRHILLVVLSLISITSYTLLLSRFELASAPWHFCLFSLLCQSIPLLGYMLQGPKSLLKPGAEQNLFVVIGLNIQPIVGLVLGIVFIFNNSIQQKRKLQQVL